MPANLPPQYYEAERRYRQAKTPQEKIEALEEMFSIMPKHKGTDRLRAELRTKIARFYEEAEKRPMVGRKGSLLYYVKKEGAGQAVLVGPPNTGKSQLVTALTGAASPVADYLFTTRLPIPGMMEFENIQIQLVDLPAITAPGVTSWLPNIIRNADLLLLVVDLGGEPAAQAETVLDWLAGFRIGVAGDSRRAEEVTVQKKAGIVANKVDAPGAAEGLRALESRHQGGLPTIAVSALRGQGLEELRRDVFRALDIIRVYTKVPGQKPDLRDPVVLKRGSTALDAAESVHKDFGRNLKYAQVWGSGKFAGQRVKRDCVLQDGDVIELHI
ncbi:MAG: TGS domain-containing protein [Chloroflexi bacterium]|nr:TGS domain-containing protein [Chloroflexota bacterium]